MELQGRPSLGVCQGREGGEAQSTGYQGKLSVGMKPEHTNGFSGGAECRNK